MSDTTKKAKGAALSDHPSLRELFFSLKRLFKNPLTGIGLGIILFFALIAVFAPVIAPPWRAENPYLIPHEGWGMTPSPPSAKHPLGTMPSQYDILYGIIWGTRNAFKIGLLVVISNLVVGLVLGAVAGYYGGIVDEVIMRIADVFSAIPSLVLAMALVLAFKDRTLNSVIIVLIILGWPTYTRIMRADILVVRNMDYILAARASGATHLQIIFRHILPNSLFSAIIVASMNIGSTILTAAALSFLGLGSQSGYADWGAMVSTCRNFIVGPSYNRLAYWYLFLIPGSTIALFVLGWNLLGDAVRDVFDPRMRRS